MKVRISSVNNFFVISILAVIFFWISLYIFDNYRGDQRFYRNFYELTSNVGLLDLLRLGKEHLSSSEPISLMVLWIGSSLEIAKDYYLAIINSLFTILIVKLFINLKASWQSLTLFLTSYYFLVLLIPAERLKIGFILLLMALLSKNFFLKIFFNILAIFSHLQLIFLVFLQAYLLFFKDEVLKPFEDIQKSIYKFHIFFLISTIFIGVAYFLAQNKIDHYIQGNIQISDFFSIVVYIVITFITFGKKSSILILPLFFTIPLIFLIGSDRVNIMAYLYFLYIHLAYGRKHQILVYLIMFLFSLKSLDFLYRVFWGGKQSAFKGESLFEFLLENFI